MIYKGLLTLDDCWMAGATFILDDIVFLLLFDMSTTNITFCVDHKAKLQTTQVQKVWKFHWQTEDGKSLLGKKVISLFTVIAQDITNPTISRNT